MERKVITDIYYKSLLLPGIGFSSLPTIELGILIYPCIAEEDVEAQRVR